MYAPVSFASNRYPEVPLIMYGSRSLDSMIMPLGVCNTKLGGSSIVRLVTSKRRTSPDVKLNLKES